jgi:hypothetical protein
MQRKSHISDFKKNKRLRWAKEQTLDRDMAFSLQLCLKGQHFGIASTLLTLRLNYFYIFENVGMVRGYLNNNPVEVILFCDIGKGSRTG